MFKLDPKHKSFDLFGDRIIQDVWKDKYKHGDESHPHHTFNRVAKAIYKNDITTHRQDAYEAMCEGLLMPGGRILSGAGTEADVTMMNCYVAQEIPDSIEGIFATLQQAASTLSKYGGIGMNFGTIRPKGAQIKHRGDLAAPGPIPFMKLWHSMADTIKQAGHRRGAMMGVLPDTHPDLLDFIKMKQERGSLTNFNVSILISDAFMRAVKNNQTWSLHHVVPPAVKPHNQFAGRYIYSTHKARDLWDAILRSTYEYSEPGVIFIDKVNKENNLQYCEKIYATNPCGEQPLPPNGTCNLAAVNLARMVYRPFDEDAYFNYAMLSQVVAIGTRFLDNVIEVTHYPLAAQREEEKNKRRLGLGISGLADALSQLGLRYGSDDAVAFTSRVMETIAKAAYATSAQLARERGAFPLYKKEMLNYGLVKKLNLGMPAGLRNGVLLTIAPTGTTSILFGNISSGLEPVFAHKTERKVIRGMGHKEKYISWGFGARFWAHCYDYKLDEEYILPKHMVEADEVSVQEHIDMQAAAQEWVDASISKTINCPQDISFDDFKHVYEMAYEKGCKGCTTYRPSEVRGAVLKKVEDKPKLRDVAEATALEVGFILEPPKSIVETVALKSGILSTVGEPLDLEADLKAYRAAQSEESQQFTKQTKRTQVLNGCTYKISWPRMESGVFLTINEMEGQPWEMFIHSKDMRHNEWTTLASVLVSRAFQQGEDPLFIAEQFKQMQSMDGAFVNGKYYSSLVCHIGYLLEEHYTRHKIPEVQQKDSAPLAGKPQDGKEKFGDIWDDVLDEDKPVRMFNVGGVVSGRMSGRKPNVENIDKPFLFKDRCPKCLGPTIMQEGCKKCINCNWSNCG